MKKTTLAALTVTCLTIGAVCASSVAATGFGHFHPYVDQHFYPDSTPRTAIVFAPVAVSGPENCGNCPPSGSRSPICPPIDNALLRLHVHDNHRVEINGYATKKQTLGGIHRNSRIYSLTGLTQEHLTPCDIVVIETTCEGIQVRHHLQMAVHAGQQYVARFPQDFQTSTTLIPNAEPIYSQQVVDDVLVEEQILPSPEAREPTTELAPIE